MNSNTLLEYEDTKDSEKTFKINNSYYHSKYSPQKEAERFLDSQTIPYKPSVFFIIEPGFDYLSKLIKNKYPDSKVIKIKIIKNLIENRYAWDRILDFDDSLEQIFNSDFTEEDFLCSQLLIWPPAMNFFKEECIQTASYYKKSFEYHKTLLTTCEYFEKKWLINSVNNYKYIKNSICLKTKIEKPVLITASGPSLGKIIPFVKTNRDSFFIMALSSSVKALLTNEIAPDLVLTTDGGYWAGEHLKALQNKNIPVAITSEAYLQKNLLQTSPVLLLNYPDDITGLYNSTKSRILASRCGTVSGTALYLAKSLTDKEIYFAGLDLSCGKGFQHIQPNELELNSCKKDFRLKTKNTRLIPGEFNSASLEVYLQWFKDLQNIKNVYRVIDNPKNNLGQIKDISCSSFTAKTFCPSDCKDFFEPFEINKNINYKSLISDLNINSKITKRIFPADIIALNKCLNEEEKKAIIKRLEEKLDKLKNKLLRIIND